MVADAALIWTAKVFSASTLRPSLLSSVHMASTPAAIRHLIDRAIRIAKAQRTVTCIIIPNDVQEMDAVEKPPRKHGTIHSGVGYSPPRVLPIRELQSRIGASRGKKRNRDEWMPQYAGTP